MPIEFRCSGCGKLLRVPDEVAGKKAQCPSCGMVLSVPVEPQTPSSPSRENPYQSPLVGGLEGLAQQPIGEHGGIIPTRIILSDVFGQAWMIFKACWGACLLGGICYLLLWLISSGLFSGIERLSGLSANPPGATVKFQLGFALQIPPGQSPRNTAILIALQAVQMLLGAWMAAGVMQYFLKIARGEPASLDLLISGGPYMLRVFVVNILVGILVGFPVGFVVGIGIAMKSNPVVLGIGAFLAVILSIILILTFWSAVWIIVDHNTSIGDSLSISRKITAGNKWTIFLIWLVLGIGGILLMAVTCGLGALVVFPFAFLLIAVAYLMMTGQYGQLPPEE